MVAEGIQRQWGVHSGLLPREDFPDEERELGVIDDHDAMPGGEPTAGRENRVVAKKTPRPLCLYLC